MFAVFLWNGTTFAFFHSDGKMHCVRQDFKIILRGLQMDLSRNLSMPILIISSPRTLFESSLLIMFLISSTKKSTSENDFSLIKGKGDSAVLPLSINEHCFVRKELKISPFFEVSDRSIIVKKWWYTGNFLQFIRVYNRAQ